MSNRQIQIDSLEFSQIRENLKDFLRGQDKFTDYDFDGSALSVILDVLAFNTHYNAMYTNMALNESFLDSASKYSSVVSLAKSLGYTAKSVRSARARVNITLTGPTDATYTIPRGTVFKARVGDREFDFIVDSDYTAALSAGVYQFDAVNLIEGSLTSRTVTVSDTSQYVIPNLKADTTTLIVNVQESSGSSVYRRFQFAPNAIDVGPGADVYFIKQREDLYYEVYFGDGTIRTALDNGNIVHLDYVGGNGAEANYARVFTYSSGLGNFTDIDVVTVLPAAGGSEAESMESIKFNAPRAFSAQNRAVTTSDYTAIASQLFPSVESVTVWGGQDNIPKTYGKVFIAAKPLGADVFSSVEKTDMVRTLQQKAAVVSVTPEIVDPLYLNIELTANVHYNPSLARRTVGEIQTAVRNTIANFATTLGQFGSEFRFSRLVSAIDNSDDSIVSNVTTFRIRRPVRTILDSSAVYTVHFSNPIYKKVGGGSFYSTRFFFEDLSDRCYLKDDGEGVVQLFSENAAGTDVCSRCWHYRLRQWFHYCTYNVPAWFI